MVVSCGAEVADEAILGHYHGSLRSLLVGGLWVKAFIVNCQQTTSWAVALNKTMPFLPSQTGTSLEPYLP